MPAGCLLGGLRIRHLREGETKTMMRGLLKHASLQQASDGKHTHYLLLGDARTQVARLRSQLRALMDRAAGAAGAASIELQVRCVVYYVGLMQKSVG